MSDSQSGITIENSGLLGHETMSFVEKFSDILNSCGAFIFNSYTMQNDEDTEIL